MLLKAKYPTKTIDKPKLKQHPLVAKAISYSKYIYKHIEHHGKYTFFGVQVDKPESTLEEKRQNISIFWTKRNVTQKKNIQNSFFLKILKAVYLGFVQVPEIGPIPFKIIVQNLFNAVRLTWSRSLAKPHIVSVKKNIFVCQFQNFFFGFSFKIKIGLLLKEY